MAAFTVALERLVRRQVQDQTGLQGTFDFDLTYTPETLDTPRVGPGIAAGISSAPDGGPPPGAPASQGGASLYDALREQLGLRLESTRAPVEVLVIDPGAAAGRELRTSNFQLPTPKLRELEVGSWGLEVTTAASPRSRSD